jgi:hypothetical protein
VVGGSADRDLRSRSGPQDLRAAKGTISRRWGLLSPLRRYGARHGHEPSRVATLFVLASSSRSPGCSKPCRRPSWVTHRRRRDDRVLHRRGAPLGLGQPGAARRSVPWLLLSSPPPRPIGGFGAFRSRGDGRLYLDPFVGGARFLALLAPAFIVSPGSSRRYTGQG